ncbi:MAG: hypothetical protein WCK01_00715 [Candidatus Uhrbacteria bacterium]
MGIKVVYNACYGGFGISRAAKKLLRFHGVREDLLRVEGIFLPRHDWRLVLAVEMLGEGASASCADLKIAELTGDRYIINEYDGSERVIEPQQIAWVVAKPVALHRSIRNSRYVA